MVGELATPGKKVRDDLTDSYTEMLNDPTKHIVSVGLSNPDKLDLSHQVVL
jgi:hypothetical protein